MQRLNTLLPVLAAGIALVTDWAIPDSSLHPAANRSYFLLVMAVALALTAVLFLAGFAAPAFQKKYKRRPPPSPCSTSPHWTGSSESWWKTLLFWASACSTPCACK